MVEVRASVGNEISANACHQLNQLSGVLAAGGANLQGNIYPVNQPQSSYQFYEITRGFATLAWRNPSPGPIHLGESAQQSLGIAPGARIHFTSRGSYGDEATSVQISRSSKSNYEPRLENFDNALAVEIPTVGTLQICYFESSAQLSEELYGAVVANFYPNQIEILRNIKAEAEYLRAVTDFNNRTSQLLAGGLAVLICIAYLLLSQVRRTEYAIYRSFQASPGQILVMVIVEAAVITWVPLGMAWALGSYGIVGDLTPLASSALLADYMRIVAGALLAPILAWIVLIRQNVFDTLKSG